MGDLFGSLAKAYHDGGIGMHPILVSLVFVIAVLIDRIRVLSFSAAIDKDADGRVSRREFVGARLPMFMEIDGDGDSALSLAELGAALEGRTK